MLKLPTVHTVVTQNRRDGSLTDTDSIQILLDTFHDRHNAFIFGTSPSWMPRHWHG
jgi:hypothetical protein